MNKNSQVLVFLSSQPLYQRNYDRFGIDILKKNGWRVYYFECSFIFRREFFNSYGREKENIKFKNLIFPKNFIELYDKLESLKPKYCIDLLKVLLFIFLSKLKNSWMKSIPFVKIKFLCLVLFSNSELIE